MEVGREGRWEEGGELCGFILAVEKVILEKTLIPQFYKVQLVEFISILSYSIILALDEF